MRITKTPRRWIQIAIVGALPFINGCAGMFVPKQVKETTAHRSLPKRSATQIFEKLNRAFPLQPEKQSRSLNKPTRIDVDTFIRCSGLQSGDLILSARLNADGFQRILTRENFEPYTHIGILEKTGRDCFVYEIRGQLSPFKGGPTLLHKFTGKPKKVSLIEFLMRYERIEIFRLPDPEKNAALAHRAQQSLSEPITYDPFFDPTTPELCCTEYVAYLMRGAGYQREIPLYRETANNDLRTIHRSLGIRGQEFMTFQSLLTTPQTKQVFSWSALGEPSHAEVVTEVYRLVHSHFKKQTPLGDVISYNRYKLVAYSPEMKVLIDYALRYFVINRPADLVNLRKTLEQMHAVTFSMERSASR